MLASVRPRDEVGTVRKALADQLADLVRDRRPARRHHRPDQDGRRAATNLADLRGVGPVVTAIVIGEVRDVARFADAAPLRLLQRDRTHHLGRPPATPARASTCTATGG